MKIFILFAILVNLCLADKIIIAHRGASAYLPEHSLESKVLAFAMGSDYIEQDLVMSKDNKLVVIHDIYLDNVSDVAVKFPKRARKDGHFYVVDFTLKELKSLNMSEGFSIVNGKKVQKYKERFTMQKSNFSISTLEDEIELIQELNRIFNKNVGFYVEIKKPWFHKQEGKDIAKATLEVLKKYNLVSKNSKIYLQSFDYPDLVRIKNELLPKMKLDIKLIALIANNNSKETYELKNGKWLEYDFTPLIQASNYAEISKIVDGVAPSLSMLFDKDSKKGDIKLTNLVRTAHKHSLVVHPYTARKDNLPSFVSSINELFEAVLIKADSDGIFTDFPDLALSFLKAKK